jgi:hypothetical protein
VSVMGMFRQPTTESASRQRWRRLACTPIEAMVRKFPTLTPQTNAREDGEQGFSPQESALLARSKGFSLSCGSFHGRVVPTIIP